MKSGKQLEIYLQKLKHKEHFIDYLEQYPTDAASASYLLVTAFNDGNIDGKRILDLGTGNGILACGASMLGAESVLGIDSDHEQIAVARENCHSPGISFDVAQVSSITGRYDTVVMNAPFGSVTTHADKPFMDAAMRCGDFIYAIHNRKAMEFVHNYYSGSGEIIREEPMDLTVGRLYAHHKKDRATIPAVFLTVHVEH